MSQPQRFRLWLVDPRSYMLTLVLICLTIGFTLIFQPHRYDNTPSYANLLEIMPQLYWGLIYILVALLYTAGIIQPHSRPLLVLVHTAGSILFVSWLLAFVVRWLTDNGTTVVNVVSWGVFLSLVVRSAVLVRGDVRSPRE